LERVDKEAIEVTALALEIESRGPDQTLLWAAAGHLQAFYNGIEGLLLRVIKEADGAAPSGADSHLEIARQAALDIPEVRPALVDPALSEALAPYRAFRHFFRHAYGVTLSWEKMREKLLAARLVYQQFADAVSRFREFLRQVADLGG
jgi:hypothetical protein